LYDDRPALHESGNPYSNDCTALRKSSYRNIIGYSWFKRYGNQKYGRMENAVFWRDLPLLGAYQRRTHLSFSPY